MLHLFKSLSFIFLCFVFHSQPTFPLSFQNISSRLCHSDEMMALLHFKSGFTINPLFSFSQFNPDISYGYPKTKWWKENVDCCLWEGVTCDHISGHVIGLDLSESQLGGIFPPNTTLFQLSHLQTLNLAYNDFSSSSISPRFGLFSSLKSLNLSNSNFAGDVPVELGLLSQLVSLDLSLSFDSSDSDLKMPHFDRVITNLTNLEQLHLGLVLINSSIPQTLANLSSLTSLELSDCSLEGVFPPNILKLPHLRSLIVRWNYNLYVDPSHFNNLTTSLEVLNFSEFIFMSDRLPEYSQPPRLKEIVLESCNLWGPIPSWIWNTTEVISLYLNQFTGGLPLNLNTKVLSQLTYIDLSENLLEGPIPSFFFTLPLLQSLYLEMNRFSGKLEAFPIANNNNNSSLEYLDLSMNNLSLELNIFSKMENLFALDLSNNDVSLAAGVKHLFSWPNLSYLHLSSCNMSEIPNFSSSNQLRQLSLSNNKFGGEIPSWLYDVGKNSLFFLNISHNNFTGEFKLHSWKNITTVDVRYNSLQGLLPLITYSFFESYLVSNNQFHGEMSSSFCKLTGFTYLDISNNQLSGKLPNCLGKLSPSLQVLDLGSNHFHGVINMAFRKDCNLRSLHLDNNRFEGKVPSSVMRCKKLQVINLGNNQLNGSFPSWLDTLPELQVLVLNSNHFQGSIKVDFKRHKPPFPKLQILDLSGNRFSGKLPARYFENFKALMVNKNGNSKKSLEYIDDFQGFYQGSLVLDAKGMMLTYKIITILTALDFSNNLFSGEIPVSVGQLVALVFLNVSNNHLTGHIPPTLANLTLLQSLDLSCNRLEGNIPPQLVRLTFLEKFNVSENQLVGPIPVGFQFSTFSSDSYEGNPSLCGDPLPKCGGLNHPRAGTPKSQDDLIDMVTSVSLWEIILIGFGFGTLLGFIAGGYMLYTVKPIWFSRKIDRLEYNMMESFKKYSRK